MSDAVAGLTEEAVERMAERYREPQPPQATPDLASEEWPDLAGITANGSGQHKTGARLKHAINTTPSCMMLV